MGKHQQQATPVIRDVQPLMARVVGPENVTMNPPLPEPKPMRAVGLVLVHPLQSVGDIRQYLKVGTECQLEPNELGVVARLSPVNRRAQTFLVPFANICAIEME